MGEEFKGNKTRFIGRNNETGVGIALPAMPGTEFDERPVATPERREKTLHISAPTLEIPGAYIGNAVLEPETDDQTERTVHDLSEIEGDETLALTTSSAENPEHVQHDAMLGIKTAEQLLAEIKGDEPFNTSDEIDLPEENYLPNETGKHSIAPEPAPAPSKPEVTPSTVDYNRITQELKAAGFQLFVQVDPIQVEAAKHSFTISYSPLIKNRKHEFAEVKRGDNVEIWTRIVGDLDKKTPE